jgi:hypothetical protein
MAGASALQPGAEAAFRGERRDRGDSAVMHDSGAGVGTYPTGDLKDGLTFRRERAAENRLVMHDAVAQVAQRRDRLMGTSTRRCRELKQGRSICWRAARAIGCLTMIVVALTIF